MTLPKSKHLYLYFFLLLSLLFFIINIYQSQYFHWTAALDQDIMIIYNSLLISSGFEQEYRDHPAYTTFVIYAFLIKIFSLINPDILSNINNLTNSVNPDRDLQILFYFCRNVNVIINISLVFFLYKLLLKIKLSQISAILSCCILIVSGWYTESFFYLRNENLAIIFFLISTIFQIKFFEERKFVFIIFSGFFFGIAMLAKIQIIFLFFFQIILNLIKFDEYIKKSFKVKLTKNFDFILFLIYILFSFFYIILQIKLQTYERFDKIRYLDLILFIFFNCLIIFFLSISNNFNFNKIKLFIAFLSLYFIGFCSSIFLTVILDLINFVKLNYYVLLRLANPFHYMIEFHVADYPNLYGNTSVSLNYFKNLLFIALSKFDYNYIKIFILFIILIISLRNDLFLNIKNNNYKYVKKILIFISILSIIFILNLRGFLYYYETLVVIPYILAISYFIKNFSRKFILIINCFLIIYFAYCNFYLQEKRKYPFTYYFSNQSSLHLICEKNKIFYQDVSYKSFLQYYHKRFDDNFIEKICINSK